MKSYDFISVDFETANDHFNSACSIGIAAASDGEIVETYYSLIRPPTDFSPENIAIHGITKDDVKNAPDFVNLWSEISHFFGKYAVLAHNAIFDMSVLKKSLPPWLCDGLDFKYIDTISLSKHFVSGQKNLIHCAESLDVPLGHHHNALDDAVACAKIALKCITLSGAKNLGALCFSLPNVKIHHFADLNTRAHYSTSKGNKIPKSPRPGDIQRTTDCIDPTNPLCGKVLVFTGELTIERAEAMQIAINAGAVVRTSVSRKTDFLVVGAQDKQLVGSDGLSGKEEKAYALNKEGVGHIVFINETQFLALAKKEVLT